MYLSFVCLYCYAEEAGVKVGQTFLSAAFAIPLSERRYKMTARIGMSLFIVWSFCACGSDSVMMPDLERGIHEVGILTQPRYRHISTLLPNGKVLIAGGLAQLPADDTTSSAGSRIFRPAGLLISAEIFDPETGTSSPTEDMTIGRYRDHGILLPDGRVLLMPTLGVYPVEMYDPDSGRFSAVADVPNTIIRTATLLPRGEVFVTTSGHAGIFDTDARAITSFFEMEETRKFHTATLLKDGRVLIVGGEHSGTETLLVGRNLIYDPSTGAYSEAGHLQFDRTNHKAVLLQDGRVLIVGGTEADLRTSVQTAEIYDPETNTFSPAGVSTIDPGAALLLPSGRVFMIHTGNIVLYDPATHTFSLTGYSINPPRSFPTATLLEDGRVMVAGGVKDKDDSTHEWEEEITDQILIFTP